MSLPSVFGTDMVSGELLCVRVHKYIPNSCAFFICIAVLEVTLASDSQEVITNEHVVAMMKAAINETEAVPPFVSPLVIGCVCIQLQVSWLKWVCMFSGAENDAIQV